LIGQLEKSSKKECHSHKSNDYPNNYSSGTQCFSHFSPRRTKEAKEKSLNASRGNLLGELEFSIMNLFFLESPLPLPYTLFILL